MANIESGYDEPTNFNPIEGPLVEPIVSLVTAVQMLQDRDPTLATINLLAGAKLALQFAKRLDSDKMSVDQAASHSPVHPR